jgi:hypothetical protein
MSQTYRRQRNLKNADETGKNMKKRVGSNINPLNAELNPICHLLALLGANHILHVSRVRIKTYIKKESVRV